MPHEAKVKIHARLVTKSSKCVPRCFFCFTGKPQSIPGRVDTLLLDIFRLLLDPFNIFIILLTWHGFLPKRRAIKEAVTGTSLLSIIAREKFITILLNLALSARIFVTNGVVSIVSVTNWSAVSAIGLVS